MSKQTYKVVQDGFQIGWVEGTDPTHALVQARQTYGPNCSISRFYGTPPETSNDRLTVLRRVYKTALLNFTRRKHPSDESLRLISTDEVNEFLSGIAPDAQGVRTVPVISHEGAFILVTYYLLVEFPTFKTPEEEFRSKAKTESEIGFLFACASTLRTNEALYEFAESLCVDWTRDEEPRNGRFNCIQAIRRKMGWIE